MLTEPEVKTRYEMAHALLLVSGALQLLAIHTDAEKQDNLKGTLDQLRDHVDSMITRLAADAGLQSEGIDR